MPTTNPRVNVTLKPSLYAVLQRLSKASGNSMSGLIAEFLEPNEEVFTRMATIIEAAASIRDEAKVEVAGSMKRVQTQIEGLLGLSEDVFQAVGAVQADLLSEVEAVSRRRRPRTASEPLGRSGRRPAAEPTATPSLTGGSHPPLTVAKTAEKFAAKPRHIRKSAKNG
ncbi:hypothetical protein FAZ69_32900 [Trinickia terrae]|uniref:Uncharacterized protein n=1 Tax=Trinickia terrae TaxID=2571161 RepID=A0A4U1HDM0_9BURK|nr:hypothetical protein [Trinickia terrae]TKC77254.1 hypothetical protein FAZ69_32900 [Trinickia terrae]